MANIEITVAGTQIRGPSSITVSTSEVVKLSLSGEFNFASPLTVVFGGAVWGTGAETQTLYAYGSVSRTTKATAGNSGYIQVSRSGYTTLTINVDGSVPDTTPDPFPFTNVTDANPSSSILSNTVHITGINRAVGITVTNGIYRVGNRDWGVAAGALNGDALQIMTDSPSGFGQSKTVTIKVGTRTETWVVKNKNGPLNPIHTKATTSGFSFRNDVRDFFAGASLVGPLVPPNNLGAFIRGGDYIPNITQNSAVATTASSLKLSQFTNAATYLDWVQGGRAQVAGGGGASASATITWSLLPSYVPSPTVALDHPRVGYGEILGGCEMMWAIISEGGSHTGATIPSGNKVYSSGNTICTISASNQGGAGGSIMNGTLRVYVRHKKYTNIVITRDLSYRFLFTGT